jgi:hypothetical protein
MSSKWKSLVYVDIKPYRDAFSRRYFEEGWFVECVICVWGYMSVFLSAFGFLKTGTRLGLASK